jgi:hypothetical protein
VPFRQGAVDMLQAQPNDTQTSPLQTPDDLADQCSLDAIRLDDYEGSLHVRHLLPPPVDRPDRPVASMSA